jgi:hypothetical protein
VYAQMHVASAAMYCNIRVSSAVVEELGEGEGCYLGALGLGRGECAEGDEHRRVNGACIVDEVCQ